MPDVFISYSRKNAEFMRQLHAAIAKSGRESWVDWEGIPYSTDWWQEICRGIDGANSFLFIVSNDALTSPVCQQEFDYARRNNKRIVPLIHEDPTIKHLAGEWFGQDWEPLARANWAELQKINWLFFRTTDDFETAFTNLVHTLGEDPAYIREHTRLLLRAREWENNARKPSFFLHGDELVEAQRWLKSAKLPTPTPLQTEYIEASLAYDHAETHRQKTRDRHLLEARVGLVIAIILVTLLGVLYSYIQDKKEQGDQVSTSNESDFQSLWSADGNQIYIVDNENRLQIWDIQTKKIMMQKDNFAEITLSGDGQYLLNMNYGSNIAEIYSTDTRENIYTLSLPDEVQGVQLAMPYLVAISSDAMVSAFDVTTGAEVWGGLAGDALRLSPNNTYVAIVDNQIVSIVEVQSGKVLFTPNYRGNE